MDNGGVLYVIYISTVIHVSADTDALSDSVRRLSKCMVVSVTGNHMQCQVRRANTWLHRCGAIAANRKSNRYDF